MQLPPIEPSDYPPCRLIEVHANIPTQEILKPRDFSTDVAFLAALQGVDVLFAEQLEDDLWLKETYVQMRHGDITGEMIQNEKGISMFSNLRTIERALKIRMQFAIKQKLRVIQILPFIESETEKRRVLQEADDELRNVLSILEDWKTATMSELRDEGNDALHSLEKLDSISVADSALCKKRQLPSLIPPEPAGRQQTPRDNVQVTPQPWPNSLPSVTCEPPTKKKSKLLARQPTVQQLDDESTKEPLESRYAVHWDKPLGEGSFGSVYLITDRKTGGQVALKTISKRFTDDEAFLREMNALLHLRRAGGHPNICSLHEHFNQGDFYYFVLDLVSGGEMFDHLVKRGAYSEADAARLVREVASALTFMHGLDTVHADLKPENIMLSTESPSDAVIKLVDFGCAQVMAADGDFHQSEDDSSGSVGHTPAYCPPEVLAKRHRHSKPEPSMDMWALGVIIFVMLTGVHPYDLNGNATEDEVIKAILTKKLPPLKNSPIVAHLSDSAIDLIKKLMRTDPRKRITALEMLEHPWVKGETANRDKMADSDKKLSKYRVYKSRIAAKVFADIVAWSDMKDLDNISKRTCLIERSFRAFDPQQKGYITERDLQTLGPGANPTDSVNPDVAPLSLSGFSDLLSENMKNKYFPKGHVVYNEGDEGHHMYFVNSGTIEVSTKEGTRVTRGPGDFFGEGALLHPKRIRSATIRCITPVHAMEISREYFEKYMAGSDSGLLLTLREKDKIRKRNRAKTVLKLQNNLKEREFCHGEKMFEPGQEGDSLFIVERGCVDVTVGDHHVFTATSGNIFGEHSLITGSPRNCSAVCTSEDGCIVHEMMGHDFRKLMDLSPDMKASLHDLSTRRDFKKAVVMRLKKEFPYQNPREAYDAIRGEKERGDDGLGKEEIGNLMREVYPDHAESGTLEIIEMLDSTGTGTITFDEFKKLFIADIRTSASM